MKNSSLAAVSATSRVVPSIATIRRPARNAPAISGPASGTATRSNNLRIGSAPSRALAWKIAEALGNPNS